MASMSPLQYQAHLLALALGATTDRDHAKIEAALKPLHEALKPFAAFAEKAEAFVAARAKDGGSPILPSTDFRLSDFKRAAAAITSHNREKS